MTLNSFTETIPRVVNMNYNTCEACIDLRKEFICTKIIAINGISSLNQVISFLDRFIENEKLSDNTAYTILPQKLVPPFTPCITASLYFWKILKQKTFKVKIRKKSLLLASILLAKKQVKEIVEAVENLFTVDSVTYIILTSACKKIDTCFNNLEKIINALKSIANIMKIQCKDLGHRETIIRTYLKNRDLVMDYEIDKIILTKITEFIARHYY